MLSRAGSSWGVPASKSTEAATRQGENKKYKISNPVNSRGAPMVTTFVPVGWRPYQGRMEFPGDGLPNRYGRKFGRVAAPLAKLNVEFLCRASSFTFTALLTDQ